MIKTYHEAPKSIFHQVQELTDGDYALVHLFEEDRQYYELFQEALRKGRDVILDNSVFELGKAFKADTFAYWVYALRPTWYIVPDVLEDADATIVRFFDFIKQYPDLPGKRIGVVQGKTYDDFVYCYKAIAPYCDKIGISFDCSWYEAGCKGATRWLRLAAGRLRTLIEMDEQRVIDRSKPHHLLGVAVPQDLSCYCALQQGGGFHWIDSVDTSNPVVHGLAGIEYGPSGLQDKETRKLYTMINEDVSPDQWTHIERNIKAFRRFCNGVE